MRALTRFLVFSACLSIALSARAERATDILTLVRKDDWKAAYALAAKVAADPGASNRVRGIAAYAAFRAGDVPMTKALSVPIAGSPVSPWQKLAQSAIFELSDDPRNADKAAKDALKDAETAPDAHAVLFSLCQVDGRLEEAGRHAKAILDAKPTGYPFDELLPQLAGLETVYEKIKVAPRVSPRRNVHEEIPFETTRPYLTVMGSVNGKEPMKMILDTGGSVNPCLSPTTAKKLNIDPVATSSAFGFGGIESVEVGEIDELKVGAFRIGPEPVAIIKMLDMLTSFMGVGGVLDTRWLMAFAWTVDFEKNVLRITDKRPFTQPAGTSTKLPNGDTLVAQPFALIGDSKILLPIKINGADTWAMFDSGSPLNMLSFDWIKSTFRESEYKISPSMTAGVGKSNKKAMRIVLQKPLTMTLAGYDVVLKHPTGEDSLDDRVSHGLGFQVRALLGLEMLWQARSFTFDGPARTMYIVFKPTEAASD